MYKSGRCLKYYITDPVYYNVLWYWLKHYKLHLIWILRKAVFQEHVRMKSGAIVLVIMLLCSQDAYLHQVKAF